MLSKKMAFSLMRLITIILVLAFMVPSAMAEEFGVTLSVDPKLDISSEDGIQVMPLMETCPVRITEGTSTLDHVTEKIFTVIRVRFDKVVRIGTATADFSKSDITVVAYNAFGGVEPAILEEPELYDKNNPDGRNFKITVTFYTPSLPLDGGPLDPCNPPVVEGDLPGAAVTRVSLYMSKHKVEVADPTAELDDTGNRLETGKSAAASLEIHYVEADTSPPKVYSIKRADNSSLFVTDRTVNVVIILSEKPRAFTKDHVSVSNAIYGDPVPLKLIPETGNMPSTGRDDMLYPYVLTITPKYPADKPDIVVKVKMFEDTARHPDPNRYTPPVTERGYREGIDKLTIKVGKVDPTVFAAGRVLYLPHGEGAMIPARGYYLLTKDKDGSGINYSDEKTEENLVHKQTPQQLLFNIRTSDNLPNLEAFFLNAGTIDLIAYDGTAAGSAYISEVMWGSDAGQADSTKSQWIEIANTTTSAISIGNRKWALRFYEAHETPAAFYRDGTLLDRIGTKTAATATTPAVYWSIVGKGQNGRTRIAAGQAGGASTGPIQPLISMYRVLDTTGVPTDGTVASSWMASIPPSLNFKLDIKGIGVGSPGAARIITAAEAIATAAAKAKADADATPAARTADPSVIIPQIGQIYISEIMFAGGGTLPQWIEISNGSRTEQVNLSGWTLTVENATANVNVSVGTKAVFTIPEGTRIDPSGQHDTPSTVLVVTEQGHSNFAGAMAEGQVVNLWRDQRAELRLFGVRQRRYSLLSDVAFRITLAPPTTGQAVARTAATDMVGNLGADGTTMWALPTNESGSRSSIIRRHIPDPTGPAKLYDGTMMGSWVLASDTSFAPVRFPQVGSFYGDASDAGTPGFRAGGALPVELSHFRPERDKQTGAVVITWSTQSELNNAGFFIKRSQQRNGEFKVINATMVPGAGTTSEKRFYIHTDTTAQPNLIYYYQIEDVSLDGNRQTLTRGIRLRGHVSVAGKTTTMWGEIKTQE